MRAVAILAVVLYHAHVGLFRGGFTGVDDFYVISGFLITGMLWRELEHEGRVSLRNFYSRRIRRLLPMSFVVLVATAVGCAILLPPLQAHANLKDGMSAALYVSNYRFAALQTSYLTSGAPPSAFQQYWSLSLEEQFYLIWPALLVGASLVWERTGRGAGRRRRPSLGSAVAALSVLGLGSFLLSLWLTNASQPWAFFSLPTRAWELAAGGLVAFAAPALRRMAERPAAVLGWVGLTAVVAATVFLSGSVPYPGTAALLPVLGTAAVIASGCSAPAAGPVRVLGRVGMRVIGRVSYSWYLWHWPVLILVPAAVGHSLGLVPNLALAVASFLLAVASFVTVENPVRLSTWLRAVPRRVPRAAVVLTVSALAVCLVCTATLPSLVGKGTAATAAPLTSASGPPALDVASPTDQYGRQLASATAQVQRAIRHSLPVQDVPANLTPSISDAAADEPPVFVDGCLDSYLSTAVASCEFGDTSSTRSVVLFGDSHAAMWFPAVDHAANQLGLTLYNWTKATCPPLMIPIISPVLGRNFVECDQWRQDVLDQIARVHPALVILGVARHYTDVYGFTPYSTQWIQGMSAMVSAVRRLGTRVLVVGPVPKPPADVPGCLSVHLSSATACNVPVAAGIDETGKRAEERAVAGAGGSYLDVQPWLCASACPAIVGNLLVYRDDNHITAVYASYLGPAMTDELGMLVGPPPAPGRHPAP